MIYEKAKIEDAKALLELFKALNKEGAKVSFDFNTDEEMEKWLQDDRCYWYVARERGTIAGVFRGVRGKKGREHGIIMTAAVVKAYRGKNIAEGLTAHALNDIRNDNIKIAYAYVYSNNRASLNTLLNLGFHMAGSVPMHHYDDEKQAYVDDLILYKKI